MEFRETAASIFSPRELTRILHLPNAWSLCLVLVSLFFLGTAALWLSLDQSPGHWDDAWYLTNSLVLYDTLIDHGFIAYWKKFLGALEFKAPLIAVFPTPLYGLFGRHSRVAYGVNLVFMALLFGAVYRLARHYSSPRAGLVAVYITATMPLLYGLSRQYLVEYGLTALVAVTVCCLIEPGWLRNTRKVCCLGALCGLGLMMKMTFPVYVLLPFCLACVQSLAREPTAVSPANPHRARVQTSLFMSLLAFVAPLTLIALPWYGRNWSKTFDHAFRSGFSPMADVYGVGDPFSVGVIWRYLTHWVNDGISGASFLLLMALAGTALWYKLRVSRPVLPSEGGTLALLWFLPFLVFLFGRNKDIRFTAPLLPAVAIVLGWMADSFLSSTKRPARIAFTLALSFPLLGYLHTSFGLLGSTRLAWGDLVLLAPRLSHARPPDPQVWPHQEILDALRQHSEFLTERRVMLGSDTAHFNANNFELAAADGLYSFQISTSAYEEDLASLLNAANSTTFFVYKEGGEPGPQFTNRLFKPLLEDVQNSGKFFDLSIDRTTLRLPALPDGGRVVVYQNRWPNSAIVEGYFFDSAGVDSSDIEMPACRVNFSNLIKLTGLSFVIEKQWLKVSYRWRCIGKLDEDLFCFTHILDNQGRVLGFLDHAILGEPVMEWEEGAGAREILRYRLPEGVNHVQLRLGLFRRSSGERLRIQEACSFDGTTVFVTDEGTAVVASGVTPLPPMRRPL
jgi:4-amino-4-deoxy-L-arabinose transferase-like glycosyltransferase